MKSTRPDAKYGESPRPGSQETIPDASNRRDSVIALLCAAAIAMTGYSLYLDSTARLEAGDAAPAGLVDFRSGDTHRRYADRALWEGLDAGDIVYNRNSIRTGDANSGALIRLNDDTRIELDQATMIVLHVHKNEIQLQLKAGSLEIRRSRPRYDRPLTIGRGDHVVELDSGQVRLESTPDLGMSVTPGLGSVVVRESSHRIRTGDRMMLSSAGRQVQELRILLLHPRQGDQIVPVDASGPTPVNLLWKSRPDTSADSDTPGLEEGDQVAEIARIKRATQAKAPSIVEISRDPNFQSVVKQIRHKAAQATNQSNPGEQKAELRLTGGVYYWRVRQGSERSSTGKFRILSAPPVLQIIAPTPGGEIQTKSDATEQNVQFAWRSIAAASHYRLEIFRANDTSANAAESERMVSKKVEREYIQVKLKPGAYRFRVQSFGPGAAQNQKSQLVHFRIAPNHGQQPENLENNNDLNGTGEIASRVSTTEGAADPSRDAIVAAKSEQSKTSAPATLQILYPGEGQTVDMASETGILFRWRPGRAGQPHRVRLFELSNGNRRLVFETTTRDSRVRFENLHELSHGGRYLWSVTPIDQERGVSGARPAGLNANFRVILSQQPEQPEFVSQSDGATSIQEAER